jgi:ATP synthase protein I
MWYIFWVPAGAVCGTGAGDGRECAVKSDDEGGSSLVRAMQALQAGVQQAGPAAMASYSLIGAILFVGGAGYLVDRWLGTGPWFLLAGLLLGIATGFYQLARSVWRR